MMKLTQKEYLLKGRWIINGKSLEADSVCVRIEWLTSNYLVEVAADESGWNKLYQDPQDKRYWELSYPESEMHGGGPPQLLNISLKQAKSKFKI